MTIDCDILNCLAFSEHESDSQTVPFKSPSKGSSDSSSEESARSETPSSEASTSGVCSMASSDFESCPDERPIEESKKIVVMYSNRDILDLSSNVYPFELYQATDVPKMNMTNYWERRSIYHRLGPFGDLDEFEHVQCYDCDFHETKPKRT